MAFLVRKIARAKWTDLTCETKDIPGDTISDLRTSSNTLSVWQIGSIEELDIAALALAASSKTSSIEKLHIVWISEDDLVNAGFSIANNSLGDTIIPDISNTHRDLSNITYHSLGQLSEIMTSAIQCDNSKNYTKNDIKSILSQAYVDGRIAETKCNEKLLREIQKLVKTN